MIFYTPNPLDLLANQEMSDRREYRLPSGGILTTEVMEDNRVRVVSLTSTDPADYMNQELAPGRVIELRIDLE
ncbi:MAG: YlzJ-like family protein [Deltaproteobacteria bacterium]